MRRGGQGEPLGAVLQGEGGKMVPFVGWELPVQFPRGILHEHQRVRQAAGLFDVAHMGRLHFRGPGGVEFVDRLITNSLKKIGPGQLLYSALCNDAGGIIDDVSERSRDSSLRYFPS